MTENGNSSPSNASLSTFSLHGNILSFTVIYSIQFIFAVVLNSLVAWIVYKDTRLKTTTNYLVANMAVSDILAAISAFPIRLAWINFNNEWLVGGGFGQALCKVSPFTAEVSLAVSVYSCFFIAIDRYYAVAHPIKKPFKPNIRYIIAVIWILSCFFKAPTLYFFDIIVKDNRDICDVPTKIFPSFILYFYVINILTFGVSIVVVTVIYVLIVYKLHKHKVPGVQSNATLRRKELQNRKVLKMSVTIVGLFYLSWGSRSIIVILNDTGHLNHLSYEADFNLMNASFVLLYMSLVYNFFIYLIFNGVYRQNFKALVTKCHFGINSAIYSFTDHSARQSNSGNRENVPDTDVVKMENMHEPDAVQHHC